MILRTAGSLKSESRPEVLQISAVVAAKTSQHKHIWPKQPQFWAPLLILSLFSVATYDMVSYHLAIFEVARC